MKKSLANKLSLFFSGVVLVTCLILVGITVLIFGNIRERMENVLYENTLESYKTEVKSEVQSAISSVEYYYNLSEDGKIDEDTAKKDALETLRNLRYGDDSSGYFWVDDTDYNLVMHPILPEQEGTNRYDLTDKNGVKIIQSIMKTADEGGHGFAVVAGNIKTLAENTSAELNNIKDIIDSLTADFEECHRDIDNVVGSNKENASYTKQVIEQFDKVFSGISFTNEKLVDINRITKNMTETVNDISDKVRNIEKGTESTAASTEEVTASSQELEALMTGVAQSCDEMAQQAEGLVGDMSRFIV